jgi:hypothetical protein
MITLKEIKTTDCLCCLQASVDDHELSAELFEKLPSWLEEGKIKPNNVKLMDLDSIHDGFDMHRQGKISSFKIVYKV